MDNFIAHILVVDDDDGIRSLVKKYLNENKYLVTTAVSAEDATEKVKIIKFDLLVLDIMMPGKSGLEFIQENKNKLETPVILLTAKGEANERIEGLEIGADDYLPKPFEPKELILRIQNIINKTKQNDQLRVIEFDDIKIDLNKQMIIKKDTEYKINNTEKVILEKMINNPGKTFSREDIGVLINLDKERSIDVIITRLRKKLRLIQKIQNFYKPLEEQDMFYGLNKFVKNILPKRLFYRALLIVAVPVIVLQIVVTFVFFDSLWIKTNKGMTKAVVNEISTFIEVYNDEIYNKNEITNLFSIYQDLNIEFIQDNDFNYNHDERWFSPIDRTLRRELKSRYGTSEFWFDTTGYKELIDIRIKYQDGYFKFLIPRDRVTSSSARIFALWITVPALIMVLISLIFLKNQTRPITNLARAAEKFGKGEEIEEFKPSGAAEIRQAGYEFDKMRKRIIRHLNQRSEMLSGISHDLRTPLTRMKLQIAFIKEKELANKLSEDINEMEKMLNEYLQFTSSAYLEKDEIFDLSELIQEIIKKYNNDNISFKIPSRIHINGRKNLIKRCINNLIDNAIKYGDKVVVELNKNNNNLFLKVEDNGPGIPEKEYDNVFKPFYKIDKGRADSKSSVGLGLSIASDIIRSHGGNIKLEKSSLKGLGVKIFLPV